MDFRIISGNVGWGYTSVDYIMHGYTQHQLCFGIIGVTWKALYVN